MVLRRIANPFYFIGSVCSNLSILTIYAEMTEWFKVAVLKTAEVKASVGSNPTLRAIMAV